MLFTQDAYLLEDQQMIKVNQKVSIHEGSNPTLYRFGDEEYRGIFCIIVCCYARLPRGKLFCKAHMCPSDIDTI